MSRFKERLTDFAALLGVLAVLAIAVSIVFFAVSDVRELFRQRRACRQVCAPYDGRPVYGEACLCELGRKLTPLPREK